MLKKSLLSLAVTASLVGLSGCNISSTTDSAGSVPQIQLDQQAALAAYGTYAVFDAANSKLPVGIDLIFADAADTDGTANVGADGGNPVYAALNDLDGGISTLAPIDLTMSGAIDPTTVTAGTAASPTGTVWLVRLPNAADAADTGTWTLPTGLTDANIDALDVTTLSYFFSPLKPDGSAPANAGETVAGMNSTAYGASQLTTNDFEVSVISLDGGTNNTIRISPKTPLDGKTKYIAVVTDGVKTTAGVALKPSQDYATTKAATDSDGNLTAGASKLASSALVDVSKAINGWESLAIGFMGAVSGGAVTADNVAISSAFTTVDPKTVLMSMAYPGYWAPSVITNNTIADAVITAGNLVNPYDAGTNPTGIPPAAAVADGAKIPTAVAIANGALTAPGFLPEGATAYEHPRARTVETILAAANTALQVAPSLLTASFDTPLTEDILIGQSAIELPQYTVKFDATDSTSFTDHWAGNTTVGAVLDGALGQEAGTTPPSDADGAKNVTYRFPFAMEKRKAVVPLLTFEPKTSSTGTGSGCGTKPGTGWPVVILQHGFTSDRTGNLINGTKIADLTCHAVVAMDLPHHGAAPTSAGFGLNVDYAHTTEAAAQTPFAAAKAAAVATAQAAVADESNVNALDETILDDLAERHQGFYGVGGSPTPVVYADAEADRVGDSGSLWIRLDSFQRTRDNMRQAVMDLMNLNASIGNIDLDGDPATTDIDASNVSYIGHSLGAIVGTAFISVNNQSVAGNSSLNAIQKAVLATPGGHLTKLVENSVGIGPSIIAGLAGNDVDQGTSTFEGFMKVLQATVDSADPMNFISDLKDVAAADIPTLIVGMYGDGAGAPGDLVVPINANGVLVAADTYTLADGATSQPDSARNPLTGLDPMLTLIGAENIKGTVTDNKIVSKYNEGGHGTFSSAGTRSTSAPDFDSEAAYTEMLKQTIGLLLTGTPTITDTTVLNAEAP